MMYEDDYNNASYITLRESDVPPQTAYKSIDEDNDRRIRHLKIRYVYSCPVNVLNNLRLQDTNKYIKPIFFYRKNNVIYGCFFIVNDLKLFVNPKIQSHIKIYPYKMYDTYVMGDTRTFNNIRDILINQGYDRDTYGSNCISTTYLNELCANKLEYIKYFVKHALMINTEIITENVDSKYKNMYVKAPYSSRSVCAQYEQIKKENQCFLDEGVIVQQKNHLLQKYEIKCYVLNGDIYMTLIRLDGQNDNICVDNVKDNIITKFNTNTSDKKKLDEIKTLLDTYGDELKSVAKKAYYCINSLIDMRLQKLKIDESETKKLLYKLKCNHIKLSDSEINEIRCVLIGLVNSEKIKVINELNQKYNTELSPTIFIKSVNDYYDPICVDRLSNDNDYYSGKIYDKFMRIDMALPDGVNYDRVTITEIEPFASGIYLYSTVGSCMVNDDLNTFENITAYNLHKIISDD